MPGKSTVMRVAGATERRQGGEGGGVMLNYLQPTSIMILSVPNHRPSVKLTMGTLNNLTGDGVTEVGALAHGLLRF